MSLRCLSLPSAGPLLAGVLLWACQPAAAGFGVSESSTAKKMIDDMERIAVDPGRNGEGLAELFDNSRAQVQDSIAPAVDSTLKPGEGKAVLKTDIRARPPETAPQQPPPHPADAKPRGAALVKEAIRDTPRRMEDAWRDPVRRRNSTSRIVEALVGGGAAALGFLWLGWPGIVLAIPAEFIYYEYLAEPMGWSGHYWERGPRDGEEFKRP